MKTLLLPLLIILCAPFACDDNSRSRPTCETLQCGDHGACEEQGDIVYCACDSGYTGVDCELCDDGYHDDDSDGICAPTCETAQYDCSDHGSCSDTPAGAVCICDEGFTDNGEGACLPPPTGKTCDDPLPLPLTGEEIVDTTTGKGNHTNPTCVDSVSGDEMVYTFTIKGPRHIIFDAEGFDTIMYLRTECDAASSELACDDDSGDRNYARLEVDLEAGTYFLIVDGYDTTGVYTLTAQVTCAHGEAYDAASDECYDDPCDPNPCTGELKTRCVPSWPDVATCECTPGAVADPEDPEACIVDPNPTGESCLDPVLLGQPSGTLEATTADAFNDLTGSCGGNGADRVYMVNLTEPSRVQVSTSGYDTVLHMRATCDAAASELACDDDGGEWQGSAITMELEAGTYYIIVDSFEESGAYELSWSVTPDPCQQPEVVCPGTPECVRSIDWSTASCECPEGMVPFEDDCVDDPCAPNPCNDAGRGRCVATLPASHTCACEVGYMDDPLAPSGPCIEDPAAAEWAVFVYLNADNNLEEWGIEDVDEMAQVGSTGDTDMVVLMDLYSELNGVARVLYVNQGSTTELENYGEIDMGRWETLRDFGLYAIENYPARHYAFIVWNHGDGFYKSSAPAHPLFKGFSNDDHGTAEGISIANGDFARAIAPMVTAMGRRFDILGFDACLMGMYEVAEAARPFARYLLASSETIPGTGYPYQTALAPFAGDATTLTATALGSAMVQAYYDDTSENSTLTLSDLDAVEALSVGLSTFADAMRANPGTYTQLEQVRQNTQYFSYGEHIDLYHFASQVAALSSLPAEITSAAAALLPLIDDVVYYHRAQADYPGSYGLAIYLPAQGGQGMVPEYQGAGALWAAHATWDEFVADFVQ